MGATPVGGGLGESKLRLDGGSSEAKAKAKRVNFTNTLRDGSSRAGLTEVSGLMLGGRISQALARPNRPPSSKLAGRRQELTQQAGSRVACNMVKGK